MPLVTPLRQPLWSLLPCPHFQFFLLEGASDLTKQATPPLLHSQLPSGFSLVLPLRLCELGLSRFPAPFPRRFTPLKAECSLVFSHFTVFAPVVFSLPGMLQLLGILSVITSEPLSSTDIVILSFLTLDCFYWAVYICLIPQGEFSCPQALSLI